MYAGAAVPASVPPPVASAALPAAAIAAAPPPPPPPPCLSDADTPFVITPRPADAPAVLATASLVHLCSVWFPLALVAEDTT